jgi:hypothetical protein
MMCSLFNNILTPADLDDRASIFFFVEGVKPDWDEPETASGGIWQVPVKQKGQEGKSKLEIYWADVVRFHTWPTTFFPQSRWVDSFS